MRRGAAYIGRDPSEAAHQGVARVEAKGDVLGRARPVDEARLADRLVLARIHGEGTGAEQQQDHPLDLQQDDAGAAEGDLLLGRRDDLVRRDVHLQARVLRRLVSALAELGTVQLRECAHLVALEAVAHLVVSRGGRPHLRVDALVVEDGALVTHVGGAFRRVLLLRLGLGQGEGGSVSQAGGLQPLRHGMTFLLVRKSVQIPHRGQLHRARTGLAGVAGHGVDDLSCADEVGGRGPHRRADREQHHLEAVLGALGLLEVRVQATEAY